MMDVEGVWLLRVEHQVASYDKEPSGRWRQIYAPWCTPNFMSQQIQSEHHSVDVLFSFFRPYIDEKATFYVQTSIWLDRSCKDLSVSVSNSNRRFF